MAYTPLTQDQFSKAQAAGFSTDQIINMEKIRKAKTENIGQIAGEAFKKTGEQAGVAADTAMFGIPGIISQASTGGKFTGKAYPMIEGGKNIFEGKDLSNMERAQAVGMGMMTDVGASLKGLSQIPLVKNIMKFSKPNNVAALANETDKSLMLAHNKVVKEYGPEYDKIIGKSDKTINLSEPVKNLVDEGQGISDAVKSINPNQSKVIDKLIDTVTNNKSIEDMSAQEADNIQKAIRNIPSIKTKLEKGYKTGFQNVDFTNQERVALKFANDIKSKVIEAHPELSSLNKNYGNFMNDYKAIRGSFGLKKTEDLMSNYSDLTKTQRRFTDTIERVIPESAKNMKQYSDTIKQYNLLKKLGLAGGGLAVTGLVGNKVMHH